METIFHFQAISGRSKMFHSPPFLSVTDAKLKETGKSLRINYWFRENDERLPHISCQSMMGFNNTENMRD